MDHIRAPAVAGTFYPGDAGLLGEQVERLLEGVESPMPRLGPPKALIVPHAGYRYSGSIAANAYDALSPARGAVHRVVLLGPAHRVPLRGLAVPDAQAFATPLGTVPLDADALAGLKDLPQVVVNDAAHALEHSLEVQLPFLQKVLGEFRLVPFAVGTSSLQEVSEVLERLWGGRETVVLLSTDLSHYHPYERAQRIDQATLARIEAFSTDLRHDEACGATPLNGLMALAKARGMSIRRLAAGNSGDAAGGRSEVVGYAAFALHEGRLVRSDEAGQALVTIARGAIEGTLCKRAALAHGAGEWLAQAGATFVTLTRQGKLRGCIGSLEAVRSLAEDVAENACGAAFRDPRFSALTAAEWPECRTEVSLLSAPKRLRFADDEELLVQLRPGVDGVILEFCGRRSTFLPQVWETLPDKRRFVSELRRKAGLPAHARLGECTVSRYRVMKWTH